MQNTKKKDQHIKVRMCARLWNGECNKHLTSPGRGKGGRGRRVAVVDGKTGRSGGGRRGQAVLVSLVLLLFCFGRGEGGGGGGGRRGGRSYEWISARRGGGRCCSCVGLAAALNPPLFLFPPVLCVCVCVLGHFFFFFWESGVAFLVFYFLLHFFFLHLLFSSIFFLLRHRVALRHSCEARNVDVCVGDDMSIQSHHPTHVHTFVLKSSKTIFKKIRTEEE